MLKVSVSGLRAHLGEYMRTVREGGLVTITDRGQPVAKLVPAGAPRRSPAIETSMPRDPAAPPVSRVKVRPVHVAGIDAVALLREERDRR